MLGVGWWRKEEGAGARSRSQSADCVSVEFYVSGGGRGEIRRKYHQGTLCSVQSIETIVNVGSRPSLNLAAALCFVEHDCCALKSLSKSVNPFNESGRIWPNKM